MTIRTRTRTRTRPIAPFAALALALATALPASAATFSGFFVFGDSLSDSGNIALVVGTNPAQVVSGNGYVPSQPYAGGTFSNGPVWAQSVAATLGFAAAPSLAGGSDYAFGGAQTGVDGPGIPPSLRTQAAGYLGATGSVASPDALYVIAGGGNNARAALTALGGGADPATTFGSAAATFANDIGVIVDSLQAAGARNIVVWNTPNLGLAPAVAAGGAVAVATGSALASAMNGQLAARLAGEAGVSKYDIYSFGGLIAANPAAYGLTNTTDACGAVAGAGADCNRYAYWDGIHPSAAAHRAIAASFIGAVGITPAVPEPETYALMAFGLAALAWRGRRGVSGAPVGQRSI